MISRPQLSPSRIALNRAQGAEKLSAQREKSAAVRVAMGLGANQIVKIKPMSDALKTRLAAHKSQFGKK